MDWFHDLGCGSGLVDDLVAFKWVFVRNSDANFMIEIICWITYGILMLWFLYVGVKMYDKKDKNPEWCVTQAVWSVIIGIMEISKLIRELERIRIKQGDEFKVKLRIDDDMQFGEELGDFDVEVRNDGVILVAEITGKIWEDWPMKKQTKNQQFYYTVKRLFPDAEVTFYSGRGMYGRDCYAVTLDLHDADDLMDENKSYRLDNMGRRYVVYTGIELKENDEELLNEKNGVDLVEELEWNYEIKSCG